MLTLAATDDADSSASFASSNSLPTSHNNTSLCAGHSSYSYTFLRISRHASYWISNLLEFSVLINRILKINVTADFKVINISNRHFAVSSNFLNRITLKINCGIIKVHHRHFYISVYPNFFHYTNKAINKMVNDLDLFIKCA